jgi:putative alpha-1,2-mannosidase
MRLCPALCFTAMAASLAVQTLAQTAQSTSSLTPYDQVDPVIGTAGGGNTFPGASLPFGMMQWSPDTNPDDFYLYKEAQIYGFSLTHLSGAGCPLYGDFAVLPVPSELTSSPGANFTPYAARFDHSTETMHPGYYAVALASGIRDYGRRTRWHCTFHLSRSCKIASASKRRQQRQYSAHFGTKPTGAE